MEIFQYIYPLIYFKNPIGWLIAFVYIVVMTFIALKVLHWGEIFFRDGVLAFPGGAYMASPPLVEILLVIIGFNRWSGAASDSVAVMQTILMILLKIRLILFIPAVLLTMFSRKVICMDKRAIAQLSSLSPGYFCSHNAGCGASTVFTFAGTFPVLFVFYLLSLAGAYIPLYLLAVGFVPYYFIFAKLKHVHWVTIVLDYQTFFLERLNILVMQVFFLIIRKKLYWLEQQFFVHH